MVLGKSVRLRTLFRKGRRFETGRLLFFFIANVPSANWREEIAAPSCREKKGGSGGEGGSGDDVRFESGMVTRKAFGSN